MSLEPPVNAPIHRAPLLPAAQASVTVILPIPMVLHQDIHLPMKVPHVPIISQQLLAI